MIYKLRFDRAKFLTFEISPNELEAKFGADHLFMLDEPLWADFWKPLNTQFLDFSDKKNVTTPPDISCWFTDQLVLNEKAYGILSNDLEPYGEFLPVRCEGVPYWVLHVTKLTNLDVINEVDSKREIEEGGYIDVSNLVFEEDTVKDLLLFKTEYNGYKNIYCSEQFKNLILNSHLVGLLFSPDLVSIF